MKFLIAFMIALIALPLQNAHAKNIIQTGEIEAQYLCHDGGNRGANVRIVLSKNDGSPGSGPVRPLYTSSYKGYYSRTTCADLTTLVRMGKIRAGAVMYVHYKTTADNGVSRCRDFAIKYMPNNKEVWVQNGGGTIFNVSCVAKDSI